jgi:hypothetical protein
VILVVDVLSGLGAGRLIYLGTATLPPAVLAGFGAVGACLVALHQLVE